MTTLRTGSVALLLALALVAGACGSEGETGATGSATDVLDFTTADLDGAEFAGTSIEGTPTVLWFWAPWCTICRAEGPDVAEVAAEFDGSVQVIGVAGRGEVSEMQQFVSQTGTDEMSHLVDDDGSVWSRFGVAAQPAFAFIDGDGEVTELFTGSLGGDALTQRVEQLAAT